MSLRLDTYVKRKEINKINTTLDRRKYRQLKSNRDRLLEKLDQALDSMGVTDKERIKLDLINTPNFSNLNFSLLIAVYLYFSEKNFDIGNVALDFDNDFDKIVEDLQREDIFDLSKEGVLYTFRQDFIIYLMLLGEKDDSYPEEIKNELNDIEEGKPFERSEDIDYDKYESLRDEYEYEEENTYDDEYYTDKY